MVVIWRQSPIDELKLKCDLESCVCITRSKSDVQGVSRRPTQAKTETKFKRAQFRNSKSLGYLYAIAKTHKARLIHSTELSWIFSTGAFRKWFADIKSQYVNSVNCKVSVVNWLERMPSSFHNIINFIQRGGLHNYPSLIKQIHKMRVQLVWGSSNL